MHGNEWIGRRARRIFPQGPSDGTLVAWAPPDGDDQALWHMVHYDGDAEDLEDYEVEEALAELKRPFTMTAQQEHKRNMYERNSMRAEEREVAVRQEAGVTDARVWKSDFDSPLKRLRRRA